MLNVTEISITLPYESEEDNDVIDQSSIELSTFTCGIIMSGLCVFGFYGNVISAIIFLHPVMRSPINILLGALSLIDLLLVCFVIFVFILPAFNIYIESDSIRSLYPFTLLVMYPL